MTAESGAKKLLDRQYRLAAFCVLRTPLLAFDELEAWALAARTHEDIPLGSEGDALRNGLEHLRRLFERPEIRHALFLASPELMRELGRVKSLTTEPSKIDRSLARYMSRMAARATPFGLFAGYSVVPLRAGGTVRLEPRDKYRGLCRLDYDYVSELQSAFISDPEVRRSALFSANDTIYTCNGRVRYVESRIGVGGRAYHLVDVEPTPYLLAALEAADGSTNLLQLRGAIRRLDLDGDVGDDDIDSYLDELVSAQLLRADVFCGVTKGDASTHLMRSLARVPSYHDVSQRLHVASCALRSIGETITNAEVGQYDDVAKSLGALPVKPRLDRFVQVDLAKPVAGALDPALFDSLRRAVQVLARLVPKRPDPLRRFKEKFAERYERAWVPLNEALDDESGIGFDGSNQDEDPLLTGLFGADPPRTELAFGAREQWLLSRIDQLGADRRTALVLDAADVEQLRTPAFDDLPDAFAMSGSLGQKGGATYCVFRGAGGPSGARMLGRFCASSDDLTEQVRSYVSEEERLRPNALFAEVVHQPSGRLGNIQARPVLRRFEIPILCGGGVDAAHVISLSDLLVTVRAGRVILASRQHGKEVIPRMSTAHSYSRGLTSYRFLCSLQAQDCAEGVSWSWGALRNRGFLPRVELEKTIVARAAWNLRASEISALVKLPREAGERIQRWRHDERVPRWVLLVEGDNEMPVDLDNPVSVDMFADMLSGLKTAHIVEMVPPPEDLLIRGPEGRFTGEFVIPVVRTSVPSTTQCDLRSLGVDKSVRSLAPGSEWLYWKLYVGPGAADRVIVELLKPLATTLVADGVIDRWFFVRYADPDWHVRFRIRVKPWNLNEAFNRCLEALKGNGSIWRLQLDTYVREVERYGGPEGIEAAEEMFQYDSELVAELLGGTTVVASGERWRLALLSVDALLGDLFGESQKLDALTQLRRMSGATLDWRPDFKKGLARKLRRERRRLMGLLTGAEEEAWSPLVRGICDRRSVRSLPCANRLKQLAEEGVLQVPFIELASTIAHMHVNRFLRSSAYRYEVVIYDFLRQVRLSLAARKREERGEFASLGG